MRKTRMMGCAAAVTFLLLAPVQAISGECASQLNEDSSTASILACLKSLETELNQKRDQPAVTNVPSGAVVAFDIRDDEACPVGWNWMTSTNGRMIVGAGDPSLAPGKYGFDGKGEALEHYTRGQHGGEERVVLRKGDMAVHDHGIRFSLAEGKGEALLWYNQSGARRKVASPSDRGGAEKSVSGANKPHNNMPPYIALYYCKKD